METIIVVPVYNEAKRINLELFHQFLEANSKVGFLFVNDGSSDNTAALIQGFIEENKIGDRLSLMSLEKNQGKAEAVRRGVLQAMSQEPVFVGYWDADLATPLHEIPRFIHAMEQNSSLALVMGARVKLLGRDIRRHAWRHYIGRIFATLASLTLRLPVYDTQCGAKLLRVSKETTEAFSNSFISRWLFDVELIARLCELYRWNVKSLESGFFLIYELVLERWEDKAGSKVNLKAYVKSIVDLFRIFWCYHRKNT